MWRYCRYCGSVYENGDRGSSEFHCSPECRASSGIDIDKEEAIKDRKRLEWLMKQFPAECTYCHATYSSREAIDKAMKEDHE